MAPNSDPTLPSAESLVIASALIAELRALGVYIAYDALSRLIRIDWQDVPFERVSSAQACAYTVRIIESVRSLTEILSAERRTKH